MQEVRKDVKGYEWKYFVSNLGNLKSKYQPLKTELNRDGRHRIKFYWPWWKYDKKTYQLHRLVYCTFNDFPLEYDWVNLICHKDDNPNNNSLDNLFLWTQSDNMKDCSNKWRLVVPILKWESNPNSKLTENQVKEIKKLLKDWVVKSKIALQYKVSISTIWNIASWKIRNHVSR